MLNRSIILFSWKIKLKILFFIICLSIRATVGEDYNYSEEELSAVTLPPVVTTKDPILTLDRLVSIFQKTETDVTDLNKKIRSLESEIEQNIILQNEKIDGKLEKLKKEIGHELEKQRQDFSYLVTQGANSDQKRPCGDFILVDGQVYLNYENTDEESGEEETCVFLISSENGRSLNFKVVNFDLTVNGSWHIGLHQIFTNHSIFVRPIIEKDLETEVSVGSKSVILVSSFAAGQKFQIEIKEAGESTSTLGEVTGNFLGRSILDASLYAYPILPGRKYSPLENRYIIIRSFPNHRIRLSVDYLELGPGDYLAVYRYSKAKNKFQFVQKFTESAARYETKPASIKYEGDENEPLLLHFTSDSYGEETGFKISYLYRKYNETSNIWKPTRIQNSYDQCGGLVEVLGHTELHYVNSGSDLDPEVCVWILFAKNNGPTVVVLEEGNFDHVNGFNASLSLQTISDENGINILQPTNVGKEILFSGSSRLLLTFASKPGQNFWLALRDLGPWSTPESNQKVNYTQLVRNDTATHVVTYYNDAAEVFDRNAQQFFVLQGYPRQSINLTIRNITLAFGSSVEIYRFSLFEKNFELYAQFVGRLSNTEESMFDGDVGLPLLVLRNGPNSAVNLSYSYQNRLDEDQPGTRPMDTKQDASNCYGLISLTNMTQLTYQNGNVNGTRICAWFLQTERNGNIGLQVVSTTFNTSARTSASLIIQTTFKEKDKNSFLEIPATGQRREMVVKAKLALLIFSSSTPGEGFQLRLRELGQTPSPVRSNSHAHVLSLGSRSNGTINCPQMIGIDRATYLCMLAPSRGEYLTLYLEQAYSKLTYDLFSILQYSPKSKHYVREDKLAVPGAVVTANVDTPIITYFFKYAAYTSPQFEISYETGIPASKANGAGNNDDETKLAGCYEILTLRTPIELEYQNHGDSTTETTCLWIVKAVNGSPITFTLNNLDKSINTSSLTVHEFSTDENLPVLRIKDNTGNHSFSVNESSAIVTFRSVGGQGFHLLISGGGNPSDDTVNADFLGQSVLTRPTSFSYPTDYYGSGYEHNEKRYIVIKPKLGRAATVTLRRLRTEEVHDTLSIFKFDKTQDKFLYFIKYSGSLVTYMSATFVGDEGQPMLLLFSSDASVQHDGFSISYAYILPNASISKYDINTQTGCGGRVPIPLTTGISYRNEENGTEESVCVWLLHVTNTQEYVLGLRSLELGTHNPSSGNLSLQTELSQNFWKPPRFLNESDVGLQIVGNQIVALLVFISTPGQSFSLSLSKGSQSRYWTNVNYNLTILGTGSLNGTTPIHLELPSAEVPYSYNRRALALISGQPGKILNMSIEYAVTPWNSEGFKVYKFTADENRFHYYGRYAGPIQEMHDVFEGEQGKPILLIAPPYGTSNHFRLLYSYVNFVAKSSIVANTHIIDADSCGGIISLKIETILTYENNDGQSTRRICVWAITGSYHGLISHTLLKQIGSNNINIMSIQEGIAEYPTKPTHRQFVHVTDTLYKEQVHSGTVLLVAFKPTKIGDSFSIRLREYGRTLNSLNSTTHHIGHMLLLKSFESGSFYITFPIENTLTGRFEKVLVLLQPAPNQVVTLNINYMKKNGLGDYLRIFKFLSNNTLQPLRSWDNGVAFIRRQEISGNEHEPIFLMFRCGGRNPNVNKFLVSYSSQPPSADHVLVDSSMEIEESTGLGSILYTNLTCGRLVTAPINLNFQSSNEDGAEKTCVWIVDAFKGGPITFSMMSPEFENSTLSIHTEFGSQQDAVSRTLRHGLEIPVKNTLAALLVSHSIGPQIMTMNLKIQDLGDDKGTALDEKVLENYMGGWLGQTNGKFSYPPPAISTTLYSNEERRYLIVRALDGKFIRLSIDFVHTEEKDDFLNVFKFSKNENKFLFLRRFTGPLGYDLKHSIFDGDENQPFLVYFHSDKFIQGKGFEFSYSYHDAREAKEYLAETILNGTIQAFSKNSAIAPQPNEEEVTPLGILGIISTIVLALFLLTVVAVIIYAKKYMEFSYTMRRNGPVPSNSRINLAENIRLEEIQ